MEGLRQIGVDTNVIVALQTEQSKAELPENDKELVRLGEALTLRPALAPAVVRSAKELGWSSEKISDVIFLVSYLNMRTRVMDAFDPPPDSRHPFTPGAALPMLQCNKDVSVR